MLIKLGLIVMLIAGAVGVAQAQQTLPPDHLVALHFNDGQGVVLVSLASAEKEYARLLTITPERRTEMQRQRFAALILALGTLPRLDTEVPHVRDTRARLDWEVRRGVRTVRVVERN